MEKIKTPFKGLIILEPKVHEDDRGYFMESFKKSFFQKHFPTIDFIQENESKSKYGVFRGLHFQKDPYAQTKLIRVIDGEILDIVFDLRENETTYKQLYTINLSSLNKKQLLVPKGMAHGFLVLSKTAIIQYKVDAPFKPNYESGIRYNDPLINLKLDINQQDLIISSRDEKWLNIEL